MHPGRWLLALALVLGLPTVTAYEAQLVQSPGDLPIITGTSYVDPYPGGDTLQVEVSVGCDEIRPADIAAGRDVPFQVRREVDYQVGFGFAASMPDGRFGIDPSPCLTDPAGSVQETVTAYLAGSELAFAFVPYNVTIGVYPDETVLVSPSAGLQPPPTMDLTVQVEYVAGVWPSLASAYVEDGEVSMDILLQTNANADTIFEFDIIEGPDGLELPPFRLDASQGHGAGLASARFPVPDDAGVESVYNWTIDIGGHAVQDSEATVDVRRVDLGIQPYKDGVPVPPTGADVDASLGPQVDDAKATSAPFGPLAVLAVAMALWSRR